MFVQFKNTKKELIIFIKKQKREWFYRVKMNIKLTIF